MECYSKRIWMLRNWRLSRLDQYHSDGRRFKIFPVSRCEYFFIRFSTWCLLCPSLIGLLTWSRASSFANQLKTRSKLSFQSVGYKKSQVVPGKCDPEACPTYPVPDSSCKNMTVNCGWTYPDAKRDTSIYTEGCAPKVRLSVICWLSIIFFKMNDWLSDNIAIIAGAAVGIAVVEMIGVIFSCYIIKNGGYDEYSSQYN